MRERVALRHGGWTFDGFAQFTPPRSLPSGDVLHPVRYAPAMALPQTTLIAALLRFAGRLRFPTLFGITAALFLIDLVVPDVLPFADEILLGLAALVLSRWRKPEEPTKSTDPVERARVVSPDA